MEPIPSEANETSRHVVDGAFKVHATLGPGLVEGVYETCLCHELQKRGLRIERQVSVPLVYDGIRLEPALRLDLLVEGCVVVELKAVETILPVHEAQVLTYLKLSGHRVGLLLNFNVPTMKTGIRRFVL